METNESVNNAIEMNDVKLFPVIEVPSDGTLRWIGGAYCLCFVYSKFNGNFILKGYSHEVEEYLKKHYTHYFYFKSMWCYKHSRGEWMFWKSGVYIIEPRRKEKKYKFRVTNFNDINLNFKRLPKHWIKEFDAS